MSLSTDRLPTELGCEQQADGLRLRLLLSPELPWFQGHFPDAPLLPGVTQIHWVMHYASTRLGLSLPFGGLDQLKFQRPLRPGAECTLILHWQADKGELGFRYELSDGGSNEVASSGRVRLAP